jgi:N-(2-amino-2-carboxyethyl)-L-glutamate synthase
MKQIIWDGILSAIGNTPIVRLSRVLENNTFQVFAKLEGFNPGGSTKDRPAASIIRRAIETGAVGPRTVVIESTSGNMGVGLAQACSYYRLPLICVVDRKTTEQNLKLLKVYGAEVDVVTEPDSITGEFLQARLNRVRALLSKYENAFWPDQYANVYNPVAHHQTMAEIAAALDNRVDYLFCATSTCGTLRGCVEYIRENRLNTKVYSVDAVGSVIFGGGGGAKRLIPGHGAAVVPAHYQPDLADRFVQVSDLDCVIGCRRLVRRESIVVGGSSGGVLMGLERARKEIPPHATCVLIFPDRGERYLDTIFSDKWVQEHFGDVSHHWQDYECAKAPY